jgi:group II intron reverse transcriptase/maturase
MHIVPMGNRRHSVLIEGPQVLFAEGRKKTQGSSMADVYYSLYGRLLSEKVLKAAFATVKSRKGAAGVDGQSIADFAGACDAEVATLVCELREKRYRPLPVRRVTIPKPDGGERQLGIPAVRDRVVQQALLGILQPIFDPGFHPSSYGYRPGRSCHQAISKATLFIRTYERRWVVDMDLSKCFDTLDHDLILRAFRQRIADGSILHLLRLFLKSGVMTDDGWQSSETGSPQGGVISPLIANVYLDAFDQFMMGRGHRIVRYADDILILCASKSAAMNAQRQATAYLEGSLKLTVNRTKTHLVHSSRGVKFLGVVIHTRYTRIQEKKLRALKAKVKAITRRNSPVNLEKVIVDLNRVLRGFANYFRIANCKGEFTRLMRWIRRRLRHKQLALWKKPSKLHRRLRQLGHRGPFDAIRMQSWRNARNPLAHLALTNRHLADLGLVDLASVTTGITVPVR